MTTATTYTETSQLSLFDFFDTFSCECGAARLAYLNLREQWIKVIAPLEHCSISYRAVIAETCPHHSNAITKPRVRLSKAQFHIWPTGHQQWFWGCLEIKCTMRIMQLLLLVVYLYISFILSIMRHNQGMIYIWLAITIDFEIELGSSLQRFSNAHLASKVHIYFYLFPLYTTFSTYILSKIYLWFLRGQLWVCETGAVSDVSFAASHSRSAPTSPLAKTMLMMLMMRRTILTLLMVRMMMRRNMA